MMNYVHETKMNIIGNFEPIKFEEDVVAVAAVITDLRILSWCPCMPDKEKLNQTNTWALNKQDKQISS